MSDKIVNQKVSIEVEVEGLNKLKDLSNKLKQQVIDLDETISEIQFLKLELKINQ